MSYDFDVCIIGSGAGGGPVALELARAGKSVLVLEKGPWLTDDDFYKDELACCRRSVYTPQLKDEKHVIEDETSDGHWSSESTEESGWDFWNGNVVGGSSNFMSGFFYRLKPKDFRLLSEFGEVAGANIVDWPISYDDLEPYYTRTETEIGVSGQVIDHKFAEARSTADFPYPPTHEHYVSSMFDEACTDLGYTSLKTPRAILSRADKGRGSCEYSGFCGNYGCSSGAKGSSRAALLGPAVATGNCKIIANAKVYALSSDNKGNVVSADYFNEKQDRKHVRARVLVVACQAIETSRLLLASVGPRHPYGLGNNHNQLGKNLLFSAGGTGGGNLVYSNYNQTIIDRLKSRGPFVNRGLQDWYFINDSTLGGKVKGGTIDFLLRHPNAIAKAMPAKWNDGKLRWGNELQQDLHKKFTESKSFRFEVFNDWLPNDNCFVSLDKNVKDKWGSAVAKVRIGYHPHDLVIGEYLSKKAVTVLKKMGAENIHYNVSGSPPANLLAGGCRFGKNIETSVLDASCKLHDADNLYVTDGSFMPTGGSVPFTWTIYANSFRVADIIKSRL